MIEFTERNSLWCLTINVGIGAKNRTKDLVNYTQSYGKNIMTGYLTIGRVKSQLII